MKEVTFREEQSINQRILMVLFGGLLMWSVLRFLSPLMGWGYSGMSVVEFIFLTVLLSLMLVALRQIRLTTAIKRKSLRLNSSLPLVNYKHKIKWEEIDHIEVIRTPWWADFSGWNIRFSEAELFFSLHGRNGIRVHLKDGRQYFIGSRQPDALKEMLDQRIQMTGLA